MKLFEDLPSTNTPITAENLNQIQDNLVVVSATEPTGDNREKVWMQKGNLYNSASNKSGYYLDSSGVETTNNAWSLTEYIPIKPNENYEIIGVTVVGTAPYCAYYDSNKGFISSFKNSNGIIKTPSNAYYVRFSINGADITNFGFNICSKIYVKNDNGVYEKFISKDNLVDYSTEEQRIGTWIDGKPLYRKVIIGNITSNANIRTINNLLGDCNVCVNAYGMFDLQSSQGYCSINGLRLDASGNELARSGVYLVNSTLMLATITNTDRNSAPFIITVKYTKITD